MTEELPSYDLRHGDDPTFTIHQRDEPPTDLPPNTARCNLCQRHWPRGEFGIPEAFEHLHDEHPDAYGDGPQQWPDGEVVIVNESLEPADFLDAQTDPCPRCNYVRSLSGACGCIDPEDL